MAATPMGTNFTDDFFRDVYNSEIEQKHKLDSADNVLAVLLMALSAVAYYYLRLWPCSGLCISASVLAAISSLCVAGICLVAYFARGAVIQKTCVFFLGGLLVAFAVLAYCHYNCLFSCVFVALSTLYFVVFCLAVLSAAGSFIPRYKAYISSPKACECFVKGLEDYFRHFDKPEDVGQKIDEDLRAMLRQQYVAAGEINRRLTIKKSYWQSRARILLVIAVSLILLNAIPTCFVECKKSEVHKVDVIKLPKNQQSEPQREDKTNGKTTRSPATPTTPKTPGTPAITTTPTKAGGSPDSSSQGGSNVGGKAKLVKGN